MNSLIRLLRPLLAGTASTPMYGVSFIVVAISAATLHAYVPAIAMPVTLSLFTAAVGFTLALILFMSFDDDMKGIKGLLVGALSGTALVRASDLLQIVRWHFNGLVDASSARQMAAFLFFSSSAAALIGFAAGFLIVRLRLASEVAAATLGLKNELSTISNVRPLPWPEIQEDFAAQSSKLPDNVVAELVARTDWSGVDANDATRAAAVLLATDHASAALLAATHALANAEPPSPVAFDLYATALVKSETRQGAGGTVSDLASSRVKEFEHELARMLTYYPESFLVNLDVGYLYLYAASGYRMAQFYSSRALAVRPNSAAANYNMACALAQEAAAAGTASQELIEKLKVCLGRYFERKPQAIQTFNREGDFTIVASDPGFKAWIAGLMPPPILANP